MVLLPFGKEPESPGETLPLPKMGPERVRTYGSPTSSITSSQQRRTCMKIIASAFVALSVLAAAAAARQRLRREKLLPAARTYAKLTAPSRSAAAFAAALYPNQHRRPPSRPDCCVSGVACQLIHRLPTNRGAVATSQRSRSSMQTPNAMSPRSVRRRMERALRLCAFVLRLCA